MICVFSKLKTVKWSTFLTTWLHCFFHLCTQLSASPFSPLSETQTEKLQSSDSNSICCNHTYLSAGYWLWLTETRCVCRFCFCVFGCLRFTCWRKKSNFNDNFLWFDLLSCVPTLLELFHNFLLTFFVTGKLKSHRNLFCCFKNKERKVPVST